MELALLNKALNQSKRVTLLKMGPWAVTQLAKSPAGQS